MNTRKLSAFAAKYKYVLIILLAGLVLLLLPTGSKAKVKTVQASAVSEQAQTQTIQVEEQRLTQLLHRDGAFAVQLFHDQAEAFFCQHRHPLLWFDLIFDGL